jgi:hypothetical protein
MERTNLKPRELVIITEFQVNLKITEEWIFSMVNCCTPAVLRSNSMYGQEGEMNVCDQYMRLLLKTRMSVVLGLSSTLIPVAIWGRARILGQ